MTYKTDAEIKQEVERELRWDTRVSETEVGVTVNKAVITRSWRTLLTGLAAIALFAIALFSFACQPTFVDDFGSAINDDRAKASPAVAPSPETKLTAPVGALTAEQAMCMLYPAFDTDTQRARWEPLPAERKQLGFAANVKTLESRALWAAPFTQGERERYFLLTHTAAEACRNCQGVLGGALYEKSAEGWQLVRETKAITWLGATDQFLQGKVVKIGAEKYGVLYRWRATNNGYTEEGDRLVAESDEQLRELFSAIASANHETDCTPSYRCWSYKSTLTFVPREGASDYDLLVATNGTKPDEEGLASAFEDVKTYRVVNGRFALWFAPPRASLQP